MSDANSPPRYKTTLIIPKLLPLLSRMTKGKSLRGRHLLITRKASILILIIIISTIIAILICWSLGRRKGRSGETTEANLSSCNTTDIGVHLTQLITESVKVSIHALKLRHDGLKNHTTSRRRRSGGGKNGEGWRIRLLRSWPLQSKLGLTSPNRSCTDGTYNGEVGRIRNRDRKMAKNSHDSRRKYELITSCCMLININNGSDEVSREVNSKII